MDMNSSWYLDSNPECGLNPLLKIVNSNSDEENIEIISWANENGLELIDLKKRHEYRLLLEKVLEGTNLGGDDCCLRGFGTLEEHRIFHEICKDQTHGYHEFYAKKNAYWEALRQAEYKELGFNPDLSRRHIVERILKLNSDSKLE